MGQEDRSKKDETWAIDLREMVDRKKSYLIIIVSSTLYFTIGSSRKRCLDGLTGAGAGQVDDDFLNAS